MLFFDAPEKAANFVTALNLAETGVQDTFIKFTFEQTHFLWIAASGHVTPELVHAHLARYPDTTFKRVLFVAHAEGDACARAQPTYFNILDADMLEQALEIELSNPIQVLRLNSRVFGFSAHMPNIIVFGLNAPPPPAPRRDPEEIREFNATHTKRLKLSDPEEIDVAKVAQEKCCVCLEAFPTCMVAPCSHQCLCRACALALMEVDAEKSERKCPLCRELVKDIYRPHIWF